MESNEGKFKWCRLPYYGFLSHNVSNLFPKNRFKIAFYNNNNLKILFNNTKERSDPLDSSGIYLLECNECSAAYVGQTGRTFRLRAEEHRRSFRTCNLSQSHFAKHLWEENHSSYFIPRILHQEEKGRRMDKKEELEIRRLMKKRPLLNDILFENLSPLLKASLTLTEKPTTHNPSPPPAPTDTPVITSPTTIPNGPPHPTPLRLSPASHNATSPSPCKEN